MKEVTNKKPMELTIQVEECVNQIRESARKMAEYQQYWLQKLEKLTPSKES